MALFNILKRRKKEKEAPTPKRVGVPTADVERQDVGKKPIAEKTIPNGEKAKPTQKQKAQKAKKSTKKVGEHFSHIILRPRITEKASLQSGGNSYTFDVNKGVNKIEIKKAVEEIYNVSPIKVNIINMKPKKKIIRGVKGKTPSFKKAIVFLKEGDSIEFV